jgi:hypothetical protein
LSISGPGQTTLDATHKDVINANNNRVNCVIFSFTNPDGLYDTLTYTYKHNSTNARGRFMGVALDGVEDEPTHESFQLMITSNGANFDFSWNSQAGKVYDLVTSTDLATPILTWPVYDPDGPGGNAPLGDIPATGTTTTLTALAGDGPTRFFSIVEKDAPPLFSEDFEADDGGFTATGTPNDWAWGTPNSDNNATPSLIVTAGNGESTKCWGTNLGVGGAPSGTINTAANSILRSPAINLTGITGASLSFAAALDTSATDAVQVLVREVGTDALLDTLTPFTVPVTANWASAGPLGLSAARPPTTRTSTSSSATKVPMPLTSATTSTM